MSRNLPTSIAPVVEQLELDGDAVVTVDHLSNVLHDVGNMDDPRMLGYELQRAGWLGSLRTRNAWEFLPAARGGAYGSGDRFIEFRAQHAVDPAWPGVLAMESAASLLGLAQRIPEREVVALPPGKTVPKAFADEWRTVTLELPAEGLTVVDRLPAWNLEGLIVGIATRPSSYRDMPGLGQWLPESLDSPDLEKLGVLLSDASSSVRQRAAYLVGIGGGAKARDAVIGRVPPTEVAWFGPRRAGGVFDAATQVNDTVLHQYLTIGVGA